MTRLRGIAILVAAIAMLSAAAPGWAGTKFDAVLTRMLAEPYQPTW